MHAEDRLYTRKVRYENVSSPHVRPEDGQKGCVYERLRHSKPIIGVLNQYCLSGLNDLGRLNKLNGLISKQMHYFRRANTHTEKLHDKGLAGNTSRIRINSA